MNNLLLSMFNGFAGVSVVIGVFAFIISAVVPIIIVVAIVNGVKNNKNKYNTTENEEDSETIFDVLKNKIKEHGTTHITCEYCGSSNEKSQTSCSKCGANLKKK